MTKFAVSRFLVGPNAPDSLHIAVSTAIRPVKREVLTARLRQILAVDARSELEKISVPILYIQAQQDRLVGPSSLDEMAAINPQIEVARIEGPHLILQRNPQECADIVTKFLISLQSR